MEGYVYNLKILFKIFICCIFREELIELQTRRPVMQIVKPNGKFEYRRVIPIFSKKSIFI